MSVVYRTTVTAVGAQVRAFLDHGVLILFGAGAPAELHDISVLHEAEVCRGGPQPGDVVHIGDASCPVLAAGAVTGPNLLQLGHLDLKADGRTAALLPGDVCVPLDSLPMPSVGDVVEIVRPGPDR